MNKTKESTVLHDRIDYFMLPGYEVALFKANTKQPNWFQEDLEYCWPVYATSFDINNKESVSLFRKYYKTEDEAKDAFNKIEASFDTIYNIIKE